MTQASTTPDPAPLPDPVLVEQLFAAVRRGETRALARAISLVEDGAAEAGILLALCEETRPEETQPEETQPEETQPAETQPALARALRIGITGPAGAGKSTLVDALTRELRSQGRRVGIVAVDPSSPFSGGAILGDRIRLADFTGDGGVYMRSLAARGHLGGLAEATEGVLKLMEAAGFDLLLIETTGVGQGEIEVASLADAVAVVLVPGMGDSIQSLKAGVLEIASVYVLNKADRPGVADLEAEIAEMLALSAVVSGNASAPPVVMTVATTGEGVSALLAVLQALPRSARLRAAAYPAPALPSGPIPVLNHPILDHLGIAVQSIAASRELYTVLGAVCSEIELVEHERVRVAMVSLGESRIELLEATEPASVIGRYLARRGEGLHHVALRVPHLAAAVDRLKAAGVRLVSESIQTGAGGHRYVFVHPSSASGVLLELVESALPSAPEAGGAA